MAAIAVPEAPPTASIKEVARILVEIIKAGQYYNSVQEAGINRLLVAIGDLDDSCKHLGDTTCDAFNVFHCNSCGVEVPQP